jgi:tripartite-type tricarboxylate transporter receptor subunit TctC
MSARRAVVALLGLCAGAPGASAQEAVATFFADKQITITVGTPPGSSASLYAQTLARHMGRHLPGNPTFIVQHLPGAGGLVAANRAYNGLPRDGTALASTNSVILTEPLLGGKGAQFDPLRFGWIGSTHVERSACISWHTSPVRTLADARVQELLVGSYGAEGPSAVLARAANRLAGTRFKLITGYAGGPEALNAMERGEVEGFCAMGTRELRLRYGDWLAHGRVNVLFQMGLAKDAELPDVPALIDHARSPLDRAAMALAFTPLEIGRPLYAPPEVPTDRLAALRAALARSLEDPAFAADAARMGLAPQHVPGETIAALLEGISRAPKEVVERARAAVD